jgi:acyl carrier protein
MTADEDVKGAIRRFVLSEFLQGEAESNVPDELRLRTDGIVDSIGTLRLVRFVEERFGVEIQPHETGVEHFDSIADIAALVARKTRKGT